MSTSLPDSLLPPLGQPLSPNWVVVKEEDVFVPAIYQSHLATDLMSAPGSKLKDGIIHRLYVRARISQTALMRLFLVMEKGVHLASNSPHLVYSKVRALRLEPLSPKGSWWYGPLQAQVHRGLARVIIG